ncbi:MAG: serine O-acetyltransferase EpsC [Spirochaetota bacterium]|nr:serine O-acetyltransferase EpsC [Spirochaetota bacterium]
MHIDDRYEEQLTSIIDSLCCPESYTPVFHKSNHQVPMPSIDALSIIVNHLKMILFPGFFGHSDISPDTMKYYIGATLYKIFSLLAEQVKRGFCFTCSEGEYVDCVDCEKKARYITMQFLIQLPEIRYLLSTDVLAAYNGDPAAKSMGEPIFCYPNISALIHYRIAHILHSLEVPLIPRIITEMAHSNTGIDIHPGAKIDESLFIDHGTGVVIGETCIIGKNVRIYQGVTLGAKSFPLDKNGNPIKGIPRHPVVEDNVIIYSGATILGHITIGQGSVIGGNIWLTYSIPPETKLLQSKNTYSFFEQGGGI